MPIKPIDPKYGVEWFGDGSEPTLVKSRTSVAIPEDEPLILFRARDRNAIRMLLFYRDLCIDDGCTPEHIAGIDNRLAAFEQFAREHPERMKQPGITRGL